MSAPATGQVAVTSTAQRLTTFAAVTAFEIKAPLANANTVYIGTVGVTTLTGYALDPGDRISYERIDQNDSPRYPLTPADFWVVGVSPDVLTWLASP